MVRRYLIAVTIVAAIGTAASCSRDYSKYRAAVEAALKDPASAQFRNDRLSVNAEGTTYYCGEVNARNAFGGYVGFRRFIADLQGTALEDPNASRAVAAGFDRLWQNNCQQ